MNDFHKRKQLRGEKVTEKMSMLSRVSRGAQLFPVQDAEDGGNQRENSIDGKQVPVPETVDYEASDKGSNHLREISCNSPIEALCNRIMCRINILGYEFGHSDMKGSECQGMKRLPYREPDDIREKIVYQQSCAKADE